MWKKLCGSAPSTQWVQNTPPTHTLVLMQQRWDSPSLCLATGSSLHQGCTGQGLRLGQGG